MYAADMQLVAKPAKSSINFRKAVSFQSLKIGGNAPTDRLSSRSGIFRQATETN